jgi:hypothetical protein
LNKVEEKRKLGEINLLKAIKSISETVAGKRFFDFILKVSELDCDPHEANKNSGGTAHTLGKQKVGRILVDKMIQAGVKVDGSIFSKKKPGRIEILTNELNNTGGSK